MTMQCAILSEADNWFNKKYIIWVCYLRNCNWGKYIKNISSINSITKKEYSSTSFGVKPDFRKLSLIS